MRTDPVVAPLTNYAVARLKRDLNDGKTAIGLSATAVDRDIHGTPLAETLNDQAYTGGAQLLHKWDDNAWTANVHGVGSWVHGSMDDIATLQEDNNHLFQRPGSRDSHFDPTRTSISGVDVSWNIGRNGDTKHWRYWFGGDMRTPGLELNDSRISDRQRPRLVVPQGQYHDETPGDYFLNWRLNTDVFEIVDVEPACSTTRLREQRQLQASRTTGAAASTRTYDNARGRQVAMRGGPALRADPNINATFGINSDTRKSRVVEPRAQRRSYAVDQQPYGEHRSRRDGAGAVEHRHLDHAGLSDRRARQSDAVRHEVDDGMELPHYCSRTSSKRPRA